MQQMSISAPVSIGGRRRTADIYMGHTVRVLPESGRIRAFPESLGDVPQVVGARDDRCERISGSTWRVCS